MKNFIKCDILILDELKNLSGGDFMKSKKLMIGAAIALSAALFVPAAVCLAGCGAEKPQLIGLSIEKNGVIINDIVMGENVVEYGEYTFGEESPKWEFKIYANYSNNSKKFVDFSQCRITYAYQDGADPVEIDALSFYSPVYNVGTYYINLEYQGMKMKVYSVIKASTELPYSMFVSLNSWQYSHENSVDVSVTSLDESVSHTIFVISKQDYDNALNSANFESEMENASEPYYKNMRLKPGQYYFYAFIPAHGNYASGYTKISHLVTVEKGVLTYNFNEKASASYEYNYYGKMGDIQLGEVAINAGCTITNWADEEVEGRFEWTDPTEMVNSNSTGLRQVIFVPDKVDGVEVYETLNVSTIDLEGSIKKGNVYMPNLIETEITYDGQNHEIKIANYGIGNVVLINGERTTLDDDGVLATVKEKGIYTFVIGLLDKDNFQWWRSDNQALGSGDITLTFEVK